MMEGDKYMERLGPLPKCLMLALSGGADSVALLLLLTALRDRGTLALYAAHVHHGLRAASDEDEAFVRQLCEERRVPLRVYHLQPPAGAGEDWARRERFARLREASEAEGGIPVALAHHRDDQAETLLLHLMRGAGLDGLGGMTRETNIGELTVIRPLLAFSRQELRDILAANGQTWREDESNVADTYLRNRVRHQLLPLMNSMSAGCAARIARTAELLSEDEETLNALALRELPAPGERHLSRKALNALPKGLQTRTLRMLWMREAGNTMDERALSADQTEALAVLISAAVGSRCNLPGGWHGYTGWQAVHLVPPKQPESTQPVPLSEHAKSWRLGEWTLQALPSEGTPGDGRHCQEIPAGWLKGCVLRTRETGDWIRPFGSPGRKSLQDYLTDRHVDAPFRDRVPLLCRGHEVLLAGGVGAGDVPPYNPDATNIRLTWKETMPWMT